MDENDIAKIYDDIEKDLIASLKRNLKRHNKEQKEIGFDFPQWQALKLKDIQRVRHEVKDIVSNRTKGLNATIKSIIRNEYKQGKKLSYKDFKNKHKKNIELSDDFFNTDNKKVNLIIDELLGTQKEAKYAIYRKADDIYKKTIARSSMYLEHGTVGINKAVDMAIKDFETRGLNIIEYKDGSRHKVSDYSRMAVRTASQRVMLHGMGEFRQEIGNPLVKISKHGGACPLCVPWEGKILIDDVYSGGNRRDGRYPLLSQAMKQGLFHPNCRHGLPTYYPELEEVREELGIEEEEKEPERYISTPDRNQYERYKERLKSSSYLPKTIEDFVDMKYNKGSEWKNLEETKVLKEHYNIVSKNGLISSLVQFEDYKDINEDIKNNLYGLKTVNNIEIKSHSLHFVDRVIGHIFDVDLGDKTDKARSGVSIKDIKETLAHPKSVKKLKSSIKLTGINNQVSISLTNKGRLIQTNPKGGKNGNYKNK